MPDDDLPAPEYDRCAPLPWFDHALLADLGLDPAAAAALLAGPHVEPAEAAPGACRLREPLRAAALTRLRERDPDAELRAHEGALASFLRRLLDGPEAPGADAAEEQLFHHLDRVFYLLAPRYAWGQIGEHLERVRRHRPRLPAHAHLLAFYAGQIALNTQRHEEAEAILVAVLDDPELTGGLRARLLNALALSEMYRNAYPRALRHYGEAHATAQAAGELFFQGAALVNMSMVYNDLGDPAEGFRLCQEGLAIFERLEDPHRQAIALYELGNNALYLGRWDEARAYLDRAIDLAVRLGMDARLLNCFWCLGLLQHFRGNPAAAERSYRMALERALSPTNGVPRLASDIHWHLGFLHMAEGRLAEALAEHDRALALAPEQRPHWRGVIGFHRGRVFELQGDLAAARAAYATAIATIEDLRRNTDDEEVKIRLLGTTSQIYEAMVLLSAGAGPDGWAEAFDYVERARSRAFLDSMAVRAPELFATFEQPVATLAEVQAALPADAALIEYFTTGVLPLGESAVGRLAAEGAPVAAHLTLPPRVLIFAVTRDSVALHVAPLDPNELPGPDDPLMGFKLLQPDMLGLLYDCLIEPVAGVLDGRRVAFVVPHGPLHYVPFNALERPEGGPLLDAGGPALATAPSATVLLRSALGRAPAAGGGALALGYNHAGARELSFAEAEAQLAARLLGGEAWTGPGPKSEALLAYGGAARVLHVACHADYDHVDPLATALHLGSGDALSARTIVERLKLHCDLVTLSACTSGLSKVASGDELLGLPRALLYAGAPAVICTLWEADDGAALLVSYFLYRAMGAGAGPAEALRDAVTTVRALSGREALATLAQVRDEWPGLAGALPAPAIPPEDLGRPLYGDPFYWAPFTLIGRP
jgi:CHAT domain-containing protein/tetratricopeptide (TPR) repeat protein